MGNDDIFKGQWEQLKGQLRQAWGKLTDDDVERINGNRQELIGILQERYGHTQAEIESEIADFLERINDTLQAEPTD